jgi:hypothetical protein
MLRKDMTALNSNVLTVEVIEMLLPLDQAGHSDGAVKQVAVGSARCFYVLCLLREVTAAMTHVLHRVRSFETDVCALNCLHNTGCCGQPL